MLSSALRRSLRHGVASVPRAIAGSERHIATRTEPLLRAVPATVAPSAEKPGFLASLFGKSVTKVDVPLTQALPGVSIPEPETPSATPPETRITTLDNGLRIASENTVGASTTVGIYVDSGSQYENASNSGVSHLLEHMAFKGTRHRSHFRLVREIEAIGANVHASASREQMAYTMDILRPHLAPAVELLADSVLNPAFFPWEVKEQLNKMKSEIEDLKNNLQSMVLEALNSVAFTGGLGRPLIAPEHALGTLNASLLEEFVQANYAAPRIVVAASGAIHEELVHLAKPYFEGLPKVASTTTPTSHYVGGDWRAAKDSPLTHVAVGFEFIGGWKDVKNSVTMTVLQMLLGGGGAFSSGGPGKGMHTRLYKRVLVNCPWVESCTAFNSAYNETGIFGIHGTTDGSNIGRLVDIIVKELQSVAQSGSVTEEELSRAKNATISSVLMNLESRVVVCEDIGRQILTSGDRIPPSQFVKMVQELTLQQVTEAAQRLLQTPLSLASIGDIANVPRYDAVAAKFK
eukprot:jgi/Chlat1/7037/Chrsp56S06707